MAGISHKSVCANLLLRILLKVHKRNDPWTKIVAEVNSVTIHIPPKTSSYYYTFSRRWTPTQQAIMHATLQQQPVTIMVNLNQKSRPLILLVSCGLVQTVVLLGKKIIVYSYNNLKRILSRI